MRLPTNRTCPACNQPIAFVPSAVSRAICNLDPDPIEDGNIVIREGKALALKRSSDNEDLAKAREGEPTYVSHFATCSSPNRFRGGNA